MNKNTIQIQSILYNNEKKGLIKALFGLKRAIEKGACLGVLPNNSCVLKYGDASEEPIFTMENINELNLEMEGFLKVEYVFFNENTGTAKGHNRLGNNCKSEYMMIMNPDIIVSSSFFSKMLIPFSDQKVALTEARQTPIEHPKEYDMMTFETEWSTTACVIFKTDIFNKIGGFDEKSFFMYCDDVDFSWRIRLAGYKLYYQPLAPVFHAKRLTKDGTWQPTAAERYYSAEAALMMAYKWSNTKLLIRLIRDFKGSKNPDFLKAVVSFNSKKKNNELPQKLDADHEISRFVDGGYTHHRFVL